jgi:signal transduction histidine kinase
MPLSHRETVSEQTILVPTLNDNRWDHVKLFRLARDIQSASTPVALDFSRCRFLRQNAVAFLGGFARLRSAEGQTVRFKWETLESGISANLAQNGFVASFGGAASPWSGNSIPYLEHRVQDADRFVEYLTRRWLGRGWVGVSDRLASAIVGKVTEAYMNAFEHSHSPVGVFCCGQHFPRVRLLNISIVDFGIGIPASVRRFKAAEFNRALLPASLCLEWAFQPGTSTKPGMGRGLGLDLIRDFIAKNGGSLDIYSNEGVATLRAHGMLFSDFRTVSLDGTLINISLKCDEKYYCFASELS